MFVAMSPHFLNLKNDHNVNSIRKTKHIMHDLADLVHDVTDSHVFDEGAGYVFSLDRKLMS